MKENAEPASDEKIETSKRMDSEEDFCKEISSVRTTSQRDH